MIELEIFPCQKCGEYIHNGGGYSDRLCHSCMYCKKPNVTSTCVYIIHCDNTSLYKIGVSIRPEKRIKAIASANATGVSLIGYCEYRSDVVAYAVECKIHELYKNQNAHHEWFSLGQQEVDDIKTLLKRFMTLYNGDEND